jgi:hypothetical protein
MFLFADTVKIAEFYCVRPFLHLLRINYGASPQLFSICLLYMLSFQTVSGQSPVDPVKEGDTTFILRDDTLFSNKGFYIFVGQHLIAGKGSDEDGHYRAIGFKSAAAFPLLFLRDAEMKNNVDYQNDPSIRDRDKVREYLDSGRSLIVRKIKSMGGKKKWHYYLVFLSDGTSSLSLNYRCDIATALRRKEILIE